MMPQLLNVTYQLPVVFLSQGERLMAVAEGAHGVVSVTEKSDRDLRMKVDNHYTLGGSLARVSQERAGHLPLLLHPNPQSVLFIGSATGGTAAAAVVHNVREIVLVEIVPEVQALAARYFAPFTREVHHDPRTRLIVEDGRNHLRATSDRYDVIVGDLFLPSRPGGRLHLQPRAFSSRERPSYIRGCVLSVVPALSAWRKGIHDCCSYLPGCFS